MEGNVTQTEIEKHMQITERFLDHAWEQFELRDLPQACEKAWGAVAHYLKAEAKLRRWQNTHHRDLVDIAYDLARETTDPERIDELYALMEGLHINFYEDRLLDGSVARGIRGAEELISRLENRVLPPVEPRPSQALRRRRLPLR